MLEVHPEFVVVRLDLKNAHNEVKRASMVRRTAAAKHLGALVPLSWATYCPKSDVLFYKALRRCFLQECVAVKHTR